MYAQLEALVGYPCVDSSTCCDGACVDSSTCCDGACVDSSTCCDGGQHGVIDGMCASVCACRYVIYVVQLILTKPRGIDPKPRQRSCYNNSSGTTLFMV